MTLPFERTRAVIYAEDFLLRLSSPFIENGIKSIPLAVREEARRVLRHFPRPYELSPAAKACPDVFDEQTILAHYNAKQPEDAAPTPPAPTLSFMPADVLDVDPPSGWRYGFPKTWDRRTDPDMVEWLIKNGYPEKAARNPDLMLRFMSVPEQPDETKPGRNAKGG